MEEHMVKSTKVPIRHDKWESARGTALVVVNQLCDFAAARSMDWSNLSIDLTFTTFEVIGELKEEVT